MPRFLIIFAICLLISCETDEPEEVNGSGLPYIGQHDVVYEAQGNYQVGDTMYHTVPSFSYLTHDSLMLNSSEISGKIWIAKFFFSHCPTICPPMTVGMKQVNDSLRAFENEIVFLSFSIDPESDTPSRLRLYRERHNIKAENWYFLTGEEKATHRLGVEGFNILAQADKSAAGGFAHSPNFVLVDRNKHIRGIYDGLDPAERSRLIRDVKKLLNETGN